MRGEVLIIGSATLFYATQDTKSNTPSYDHLILQHNNSIPFEEQTFRKYDFILSYELYMISMFLIEPPSVAY